MPDPHIVVTRRGRIGVLTLARPEKMNALTLPMVHALREASLELHRDPDVWVIVLRAEGDRAFSVGGDLKELLPEVVRQRRDALNPEPSVRFFSDVYTPIVAAVRGLCLGGGFEMLLGTDIRIVGDTSTFALPETGIGLIPGSGTNVRLTRQLGWARAMELLLLGDRIDAARALQIGLVNEVVADADVDDRAFEVAERMLRNGPVALRTAKEIAVRSWNLEPAFELEYALNSRVIVSQDAATGIGSFSTKTPPDFRNR
jgi:enoyl-CoA hydratase